LPTEDSTLFSLDRLTRKQAQASAAVAAEDSGLIDLDRLTRAAEGAPIGSSAGQAPGFAAPPPLLARAEETTLRGVSAVQVERPKSRGWLTVYAAGVALVGLLLGVLLDDVLDERRAPTPVAATVVVFAAPAVTSAEPRPGDRSAASEPVVASASAVTSAPPDPPGSRPHARQPSPQSPKPSQSPNPPQSETTSPAKSDPCARCNGDLACAMRCSVRGSK
jgi:hypothetical protein